MTFNKPKRLLPASLSRGLLRGTKFGSNCAALMATAGASLGKNEKGQNLTLVDGVAATRRDVANLQKTVNQLAETVSTLVEKDAK